MANPLITQLRHRIPYILNRETGWLWRLDETVYLLGACYELKEWAEIAAHLIRTIEDCKNQLYLFFRGFRKQPSAWTPEEDYCLLNIRSMEREMIMRRRGTAACGRRAYTLGLICREIDSARTKAM